MSSGQQVRMRRLAFHGAVWVVTIAAAAILHLGSQVLGQAAPPLPTAEGRPPLTAPGGSYRASPLPSPQPTATEPAPEPDLTPVATATPPESAARAYRVRGTVTSTALSGEATRRTEQRSYEITVAPDAGSGEANRHLRVSASGGGQEDLTIALYEVGNAAVTVAGPDQWIVQARGSPVPLSRAVQPLMDLAALAQSLCTGAPGDSDAARAANTGACVVTDADEVARLLTSRDASLTVPSSLLAARMDEDGELPVRYLLTAEVASARAQTGSVPVTYRIEWSYELVDAGGETQMRVEWPAEVPPMNELDTAGLAAGVLPSPDRLLAVARTGDNLRMHVSLNVEQSKSAMIDSLREAGWTTREMDGAILADRGDESIALLLDAGGTAGTSYVEMVRIE